MRSSLEDSPSPIFQISSWLTSRRNYNGNTGSKGAEREMCKHRQFLANKSPYPRNGASWDHNDRLTGSHIRAFDLYQNYRPWITLNGRNALCCRKDASFGAHCRNWNEDRPILSAAKMQANDYSLMTIVSGNIRCMRIFVGVPLCSGIK